MNGDSGLPSSPGPILHGVPGQEGTQGSAEGGDRLNLGQHRGSWAAGSSEFQVRVEPWARAGGPWCVRSSPLPSSRHPCRRLPVHPPVCLPVHLHLHTLATHPSVSPSGLSSHPPSTTDGLVRPSIRPPCPVPLPILPLPSCHPPTSPRSWALPGAEGCPGTWRQKERCHPPGGPGSSGAVRKQARGRRPGVGAQD